MYIIVFVTTPNFAESEKIANVLLQNRLAACVNILPTMRSMFWWKGRIEREDESLMIIKTRKDMFNKLVESVRTIHKYEIPEIIAFEIQGGLKEYLTWIDEVIGHTGD